MLKDQLELLLKEFTTLKEKIKSKLQTLTETTAKLAESNHQLELVSKEQSENKKLLKELKELGEELNKQKIARKQADYEREFKEWLIADASRKRKLDWEKVIVCYGTSPLPGGYSMSYDGSALLFINRKPRENVSLSPYIEVMTKWKQELKEKRRKEINQLETKLLSIYHKLEEWIKLISKTNL